MSFFARILCAVLLTGGPGGAVDLKEDVPAASTPRSGEVTGTILPAKSISRMFAVSRETGKAYSPTSFDKKTGKFVFKSLPGDAVYDLGVWTSDGRTIEGIDLSPPDARLLRLAVKRRRELKLPPERSHKFGDDDVRELQKFVRDMKDFMEEKRVLYIHGHGRRATMLIELMRTRGFHSSQGTIIWRVELWYFEHKFGGWEKLANQEKVLRRERTTPDGWRKIGVEYYPELSVRVTSSGYARPVKFTIPATPDASRGRPAGTEPKLKSDTHVLGLDIRQPSSAPAQPGATAVP